MIREVLRMGNPQLLQRSKPVDAFGTPELDALLADMRDTMKAKNGAGLAAPQIGVLQQVVIFGFEQSDRYPDAEPVPYTELVNPVLTVLSDEIDGVRDTAVRLTARWLGLAANSAASGSAAGAGAGAADGADGADGGADSAVAAMPLSAPRMLERLVSGVVRVWGHHQSMSCCARAALCVLM